MGPIHTCTCNLTSKRCKLSYKVHWTSCNLVPSQELSPITGTITHSPVEVSEVPHSSLCGVNDMYRSYAILMETLASLLGF